jgi:hypothetical protein
MERRGRVLEGDLEKRVMLLVKIQNQDKVDLGKGMAMELMWK